jgi:hypothetical protein
MWIEKSLFANKCQECETKLPVGALIYWLKPHTEGPGVLCPECGAEREPADVEAERVRQEKKAEERTRENEEQSAYMRKLHAIKRMIRQMIDEGMSIEEMAVELQFNPRYVEHLVIRVEQEKLKRAATKELKRKAERPPNEKRCPKCEAMKPSTGFHRNRRSRDGLQSYCKECLSAMGRASRARNREVAEMDTTFRTMTSS